jgi:hypothetical protein
MSVFGVKFDFVVARSILTHMTPGYFRRTVREFAINSRPQGIFMASYLRRGDPLPAGGENGDELQLEDQRFVQQVEYSFSTVQQWSSEFGLKVSEWKERPKLNGQTWIKFERDHPGRRNRVQ